RGFEDRAAFPDGTAVAIGNFDWLHLGHQEILRFLVEKARTSQLGSLVLTFSPHPEKVLGGGRTPMIQTLEQRLRGLRASGVEAVLVAKFTPAFADLSMEEFVSRIIVHSLAAQVVVVGENFRFGRRRHGDIDDLRRLGRKMGFSVYPRPAVHRKGQVVSSSRIRNYLQSGDIFSANALLGYPYLIEGRVIKGRGRGRALGFPTANIRTENEIAPPGVHLTWARIRGRFFPSLTNNGSRPTFGAGPEQIETYVFDFDGPLYRRRIGLHFVRRLRKEKRFPGADALIRQIRRDVTASRLYFANAESPFVRIRVRARP
ncbi:MAG: riboflavin biosynthesis protein RibF, partial [Candidatus Aminicenantes bacterium]|nr:riboflavin biosynthesis protein RibF [Candidatus Aminicenantes bacterium]